jgi:hypothetical protein
MTAKSSFQHLAGLAVDFCEYTVELLGHDLTRAAIITDLGGDPARATSVSELPASNLQAIRDYRDQADPDFEADVQVARDIASVLDALIGQIKTWSDAFDLDDPGKAAEEILLDLGYGLLELCSSAWVRFRWPRLFFVLEAASAVTDTVSTYGPADAKYGRLVAGVTGVLGFLLQPGKTFSSLDLHHKWKDHIAEASIDGGLRLGAAILGIWDGIKSEDFDGIEVLDDTYAGWDSPALSIDSPDQPTNADLIASHMVSFSLVNPPKDPDADLTETERLLVTLMYVPTSEGGPGVFLALGGSLTIDEKIGKSWVVSGRLQSDAGLAAMFGKRVTDVAAGLTEASQTVALSSVPDPTTALSFSIPKSTGTRLDLGQVVLTYELGVKGISGTISLKDAVFVLDRKDFDSFIKHVLPQDPARLPFSVTFGYGSEHGLILEGTVLPSSGTTGPGVKNSPLPGGGGFDAPVVKATIPLSKRLGPVTIHEVAVAIQRGKPDAPGGNNVYAVAGDVSFSVQLGPVYFRLDQVGLGVIADFSDQTIDKNLSFVDAHFAINPPLGIAIQVDTGPVSGGGVIFHDPAQGLYYGALALRFRGLGTLKAIGLVSTRMPDGTERSSFIIIATLEGLGLRLGPLTIEGFGLLIAVDRTFDEDAMRAALPSGQLKNVLFPADPVHHTTAVLQSLQTFFPARADSNLLGLLVRLSFGTQRLIRLDLALILQFGKGVSDRFIVLGRVSSLLPDEAAPLIRLNLDAVGIFDPSEGVAALDAVLVDSKLCGRFALTGSAAFRRTPGQGGFALSVGGFHPSFKPPDGFPELKRVTLALTAGDNPKLICEYYLAITANTIQLGANATLYASACGFSLDGNIGFDVLIEPLRFHYLASFHASVQLKRGSTNLFKVSVSGELEGTIPLRVAGKASFEILWCDFSVSFDKTLVGGSSDRSLPPVDVHGLLLQQLSDPRHWTPLEPGGALQLVTLRPDRPDAARVLLHPMGSLTVKQGAVPLNVDRDLDRVGSNTLSGQRRFSVRLGIGDHDLVTSPVKDLFAPADFFDLSDDEKLAAPSFEEMEAGVTAADTTYSFDHALTVSSPFDYTDITIDAQGQPHVADDPHHANGGFVFQAVLLGAAATAPTRVGRADRFTSAGLADAPRLRAREWAVAASGEIGVEQVRSTWVEARAVAGKGIVVPL